MPHTDTGIQKQGNDLLIPLAGVLRPLAPGVVTPCLAGPVGDDATHTSRASRSSHSVTKAAISGSMACNSAIDRATQSTCVTERPGVGGESSSCAGKRGGDKNELGRRSPPCPPPGVGGDDGQSGDPGDPSKGSSTTGVPGVGGVAGRASVLVSPGVGRVSSLTTDVLSVTGVVGCSSDPEAPGVGGVSGLTTNISLWWPCSRSRNSPIYLPRADASFRS